MSAEVVNLTASSGPLVECTSWCTDGDSHPFERPGDRSCCSEFQEFMLSTHPSIEDVARIHHPDALTSYLRRHDGEQGAGRVAIHHEATDNEIFLTIPEARQLLARLTELVDLATRTNETS